MDRSEWPLSPQREHLTGAYPPFILASTAAAMEMEVGVFFTLYGLTLLKKEINPKVALHANPGMPMKMPFGPDGFQKIGPCPTFSWETFPVSKRCPPLL